VIEARKRWKAKRGRGRERELTTNTMAFVSTCGEHAIKRLEMTIYY
jgi:hypothetical protein